MLEDVGIRKAFCANLRDEIAVGWKERGSVFSDLELSAHERPNNIFPGQFSVQ